MATKRKIVKATVGYFGKLPNNVEISDYLTIVDLPNDHTEEGYAELGRVVRQVFKNLAEDALTEIEVGLFNQTNQQFLTEKWEKDEIALQKKNKMVTDNKVEPGWTRQYRDDKRVWEDICEHGVGHEPDVHGCDGCCKGMYSE